MRLTPRNTQFYDMFTAAASNALDAALMLTKLVNADYEQRPELARQLKDLEHVADQTTHDVMRALNTSFITPFDREDIAVLAARMDDIVDHIWAAADLTPSDLACFDHSGETRSGSRSLGTSRRCTGCRKR